MSTVWLLNRRLLVQTIPADRVAICLKDCPVLRKGLIIMPVTAMNTVVTLMGVISIPTAVIHTRIEMILGAIYAHNDHFPKKRTDRAMRAFVVIWATKASPT